MKKRGGLDWVGVLGFLACLGAGAPRLAASPQNPDVIVYDVGVNGGDTNDIEYYGQNGGIAAYSIGTQSCNRGTSQVDWYDGGGDTRHPVIAQNMFRYKNGRFEQLGQSWLKHGFCAVNETETFCAPCQQTPCDTLGIGCADTYWATLNDGGGGRSKRFVNAATGAHVESGTAPSGNSTIRGRLQCAVADMDPAQNPGAQYYIEGQYVTADDAAAGNSANNASWRRVTVNSVSNVVGGGPTAREEPAIYAWQDVDHEVDVQVVMNIESSGNKTLFLLGSRVTQTGPGLYHYEYAIQNLTSDQSANAFVVPVDAAVQVSNIGFHDVNYHSGDPYDGTDWASVRQGGELTWSTADYNTNQNANALRWGTLYNWRFDANAEPVLGTVTLGLFKPGPNSSLDVPSVLVPGAPIVFDHNKQQSGPPTGPTVHFPFTSTRTGTYGNPSLFIQTSPAAVGGEWTARVEIDESAESFLMISRRGPSQGVINRMGELLIQPPFTLYRGKTEHSIQIPNDPSLVGVTLWTQAAALTPAGWKLTNALDVTIGMLQ